MPGLRDALRLTADQTSARCDPEWLPFDSTDELVPLEAVFGQERAVRAIEFALGMKGPGYNLFAAGPDGIGKTTIVESFLRRRAEQLPPPPDYVYVRNFDEPDTPVAIAMPAGEGPAFAHAVERVVERAGNELQGAFESDAYARRRQELVQEIEREREEILRGLQAEAREHGFLLQMTQTGVSSTPLVDDKPLAEEGFRDLPDEQKQRIREQAAVLEQRVNEAMLRMRGVERAAQERATQLDEQVAGFAIGHLFEPLLERHADNAEVVAFLNAVREDMRAERERIVQAAQPQQQQQMPIPGLQLAGRREASPMRRYEVNALVTNDPQRGAPVVHEVHPTYYNLLGRIEYQGQFGTMVTDHTMVKAGALARANGGFLIVKLRDLLSNVHAYDGLKRAMLAGELSIENISEAVGLVPTSALRPEPIRLDLKLVIVGDAYLYALLYRHDPDFRELFRVKADFEVEFERTAENALGLASYVRGQCDRNELRCFTRSAVARLLEHSSRMVEDRRKLSANMAGFLDILRQADYWAGVEGADLVRESHVERAIEERVFRSALVRDRLQEAIREGTIHVETEGERIGQINALTVYDLGDISFGSPTRITAIVSPGRGTIVMIDRESNMSGRIHSKGFLILRGFLADVFGMHKATALHASLTFEQLYGDVDGDSASSTELYALLSALAGAPLDQQLAVTGSVDQLGRIQPIGGANAKIEGFFDVCVQRGLTGNQGVLIPRANVNNLTLRPEVVRAIEDGRFHIWAVERIEEGIELLTGVPAGERGEDGTFPEGTIFRRVADRLEQFFKDVSRHVQQAPAIEAPHVQTTQAPPPMPPGIPPPPPPEPPVIV